MDTCPQDDRDEAAWVLAAREGDGVAFGHLYDAHAQLVYRYCARRVQELAAAEDLLSVVFLEAWRTRAGMDVVDGSARAWLLGIACNVCRTSSRARRRQARAVARYAGMRAHVVEADPAAGVDERLSAVVTARAVAELCLVEGLTVTAAATVLGQRVSTTHGRLARARARLARVARSGEDLVPAPWTGHVPGERTPRAATETPQELT